MLDVAPAGANRNAISWHPLNLALAFFLELGLLAALAYWGWTTYVGAGKVLFGLGLPVAAAALWGIFRVPGLPGKALVAIPGAARLALELGLFALAVILLATSHHRLLALIFGAVVIAHYLVSYDRIRWMLTHKSGEPGSP